MAVSQRPTALQVESGACATLVALGKSHQATPVGHSLCAQSPPPQPVKQAQVKAGERFDYRFTPPDAGTFWYHAPQDPAYPAGHGLYGALIVDERTPPDVDRDVLLLIDDWWLDGNVRQWTRQICDSIMNTHYSVVVGGSDLLVCEPGNRNTFQHVHTLAPVIEGRE